MSRFSLGLFVANLHFLCRGCDFSFNDYAFPLKGTYSLFQ